MNNIYSSCYGAKTADNCYTCDSVKKAYDEKGWTYNSDKFKQCNNLAAAHVTPSNTTFSSCYGAKTVDGKTVDDCYTCDSVKKAYDDKFWKYNSADFKQCNPATTNKPSLPLPNLPQSLPYQTSQVDNSSSFMIFSLFVFIFIIAIILSVLPAISNIKGIIDVVNKNYKTQTLTPVKSI